MKRGARGDSGDPGDGTVGHAAHAIALDHGQRRLDQLCAATLAPRKPLVDRLRHVPGPPRAASIELAIVATSRRLTGDSVADPGLDGGALTRRVPGSLPVQPDGSTHVRGSSLTSIDHACSEEPAGRASP